MEPEILLQEYDATRGVLRDLLDHDLLILVGRLASEYFVRRGGASDSEITLVESIGTGIRVARAVLDAQRIVLEWAVE